MSRMESVSRRVLFAVAAVALLAGSPARAQSWPSRTVTIVSPFAAGSGVDILARHLGN